MFDRTPPRRGAGALLRRHGRRRGAGGLLPAAAGRDRHDDRGAGPGPVKHPGQTPFDRHVFKRQSDAVKPAVMAVTAVTVRAAEPGDRGLVKQPDRGLVKQPERGLVKQADRGLVKQPDRGLVKQPDPGKGLVKMGGFGSGPGQTARSGPGQTAGSGPGQTAGIWSGSGCQKPRKRGVRPGQKGRPGPV